MLFETSTNGTKTKIYTHIPTHSVNALNVIAHYIHPSLTEDQGYIRVFWRLVWQVQRIYHSKEADKSSLIFMLNKMSTHPTRKPPCIRVHSSWEINKKSPPHFRPVLHWCSSLCTTGQWQDWILKSFGFTACFKNHNKENDKWQSQQLLLLTTVSFFHIN